MDPAFAARLAPLQTQLEDPDGPPFSGSAMLRKLRALLPAARRAGGEDGPESAVLHACLALLQGKRGETAEQIRHGELALRLGRATGAIAADGIVRLHHGLCRACEDAGDLERMAVHAAAAVEAAAGDPSLTASQRLGLRQRLGYCLHLAGRPAEALAANRALLADAEAAFGAGDARMVPLLTNLAQNEHALSRPAEAAAWLERALALATAAGDDATAFDLEFQLGVLAHETGDPAAARRRLEACAATAERADDDGLRERAAGLLAELEQRGG